MNIRNLIRTAMSISTDDSKTFRLSTSRWLGIASQRVESFVPHGSFGCPLAGNPQLLFSKRGNQGESVALEGSSSTRIKKNCVPGEYGIGNEKTGSYQYHKDDGTIETATTSLIGGSIFRQNSNGSFSINKTTPTPEEFVAILNEMNLKIIEALTAINAVTPGAPAAVQIAQLAAIQVRYMGFIEV